MNRKFILDQNFDDKSLKPLATKRGALPSLLGYALNSQSCPPEIRERFESLAALRDAVLHTGQLKYVSPSSPIEIDVGSTSAIRFHNEMMLELVDAIGQILEAKGYWGGRRGMVNPRWRECKGEGGQQSQV